MANLNEKNKYYKAPDGVTISYFINRCPGAKYTLLMLHGLASNHTRWTEFTEHTQLARHMNLLSLDLRGHGRSVTKGRINHDIWQQDLRGILQQESLDQIIIVGHSMGAQLALHYALRHPAQICGLLLIDPTLPSKLRGKLEVAKRFRILLKLYVFVLILFNRLTRTEKRFPDRDLHLLDIKTRELMEEHSTEIIAKLYTTPSADLKYMSLANYLQDLYATTGALPELTTIHCPVKVVLSTGSTIVDAGAIKNRFAPDLEFEVAEINANHWPLTEKPDETREAIDKWCLALI